ncbi:MAG: paraquat-inducible protein A [Planctomycetota bacterium]|jgi:paraquat-inducible protein A
MRDSTERGNSKEAEKPERRLKACPCCGLIQQVAEHGEDYVSRCPRCGVVVDRGQGKDVSSQRTAAAAIGALVLFPAAVTLPILEIERLGYRHASSLLGGIVELFHSGSWFIATVILLFSIVLPIVKLVTLLELCWFRYLEHHHRAWAYRMIEFSGRWSMMDVMLLAFLVMLIKLSGLVEFHVGPAVIAFSACVVMSMIASMSFDPHSIWAEE